MPEYGARGAGVPRCRGAEVPGCRSKLTCAARTVTGGGDGITGMLSNTVRPASRDPEGLELRDARQFCPASQEECSVASLRGRVLLRRRRHINSISRPTLRPTGRQGAQAQQANPAAPPSRNSAARPWVPGPSAVDGARRKHRPRHIAGEPMLRDFVAATLPDQSVTFESPRLPSRGRLND